MSTPDTVLVTYALDVGEALSAMHGFGGLDDIEARLCILAGFARDPDLDRVARQDNVDLVYLPECHATFSLRRHLRASTPTASRLALWPRGGVMTRAAGLRAAFTWLDAGTYDLIGGLVRHRQQWNSGAGMLRSPVVGDSAVWMPMESGEPEWSPAGAHSLAPVSAGGDVVVLRLDALPEQVALGAEALPWGLRIWLGAKDGESAPRSAVFSGLQVQTAVSRDELATGTDADHERLYRQLLARDIGELVLFSLSRLVRDDDLRQSRLQRQGRLGVEGDIREPADLGGFYRSPINAAVIGPLYRLDDEWTARETVPKSKLRRANKALARARKLRAVSVYHAPWKDLLYHLLNRLSGGRFRPGVRDRYR